MHDDIKTVVILCGHHSGSSMVAGCLHRMGVEMEEGESHKEIGGIHPWGMWERKEFELMNKTILARAKGNWHTIPPQKNIEGLIDDKYLDAQIKELLEKTEKPLWGWKDPRNALTIPVWHPHITNPHYVVVKRNLDSIVDSYMCEEYRWKFGRDFKTREQAIEHIMDYYERIDGFVDGTDNVVEISYEDMLGNPGLWLIELAGFVGVRITEEAFEMVDPSLRHF